jgi:hypothetical protein
MGEVLKEERARRKPGRPATGKDPVVPVRLPPAVLAQVEAWRSRYADMSMSTAMRCLLGLGLNFPEQNVVRDPKDPQGRWVLGRVYEEKET